MQVGTSAIAALRAHRVRQTAERLRAGSAWEDPDIVVASEAGTPLDAGNVLRRAFRRTLTRAKLPLLPFHALRHTSVTRRNHPRTVADRLGHATPSLVMNVYGHVTDRMQAEATAALERVLGA